MPEKFFGKISFIFILFLLFLTSKAVFSGSCSSAADEGMKLTSLTLHLSPGQGLILEKIGLSNQSEEINLPSLTPLFSLLLSDQLITSVSARPFPVQEEHLTFTSPKPNPQNIKFKIDGGIIGTLGQEAPTYSGLSLTLRLENSSTGKIKLENLVPLGEGADRVYITAGLPNTWPYNLNRTLLYRPGKRPIGVLLPDNAWHLGFVDLEIKPEVYLTGLARRGSNEKAEVRRWAATLEPGGWIEYRLYFDVHSQVLSLKKAQAAEHLVQLPAWLAGLKMMFQERYLYDLEKFDNALYERKDLQWIRKAYLMLLQFAWDHSYYDWSSQKYTFYQDLFVWDKLLGGIDIYSLWPTWPRLGLDQRNQFDMYQDLPGGLPELKRQVAFAHQKGKKFFISYNPWDEGTRKQDHLSALENLLREIKADGLILDTWGESSRQFQAMADRVKPGIIMYPEGMAVPKDMPGVVAGRVHDALYLPPPLNLNKFIKPEIAIFRVIQPGEGPFHREVALAFFNGYGTELNTMRPGRPGDLKEDLKFLGQTLKILRENHSNFVSPDWIPLYSVLKDGIWANCWPDDKKIIFTIFSLIPEGYSGPLIPVIEKPGWHYVSLWHHKELKTEKINSNSYLPVEVKSFNQSLLGTRQEGNVECLAILPEIIQAKRIEDRIIIKLKEKPPSSYLVITPDNPSYQTESLILPASDTEFSLWEKFKSKGEKVVIQLFSSENEILDEAIIDLPLALPRLISIPRLTPLADKAPEGMVDIPGGDYVFQSVPDPDDPNPVIPYPEGGQDKIIKIRRFFIDRYPVTNAQFALFLQKTGYKPKDPTNFLKHWVKGLPPAGQENHPVVWVSLKDAEAYAHWAGKRLPTEVEWQYAAQATDGRLYPWGNELEAGRCNNKSGQTEPVNAHPSGASPFGVEDLVGNVWQLTSDVYDNGAYTFVIIKGGSYYAPAASIWYPKSGPLPLNRRQMLLLVAPGLDRCATVGFRCVKDAVQKK